jgi:hypothetical protein
MTIKEFSQKHSLVFFWATIVLVVLFLLTTCMSCKSRHMMMKGGDGYDRYDKKMMNKPSTQGQQRQMMGPGQGQGYMINNTPGAGAAGTVEAGTQADPNIPVEVQ